MWRYEGDPHYTAKTLIRLDTLKGDKGDSIERFIQKGDSLYVKTSASKDPIFVGNVKGEKGDPAPKVIFRLDDDRSLAPGEPAGTGRYIQWKQMYDHWTQ